MSFFGNSGPFDGLFDLDNDGNLDFLETAQRDAFFWDDENNNDSRDEVDFNNNDVFDNDDNWDS